MKHPDKKLTAYGSRINGLNVNPAGLVKTHCSDTGLPHLLNVWMQNQPRLPKTVKARAVKMNLEAVKEAIYDLAAMFFKNTAVIWAEQINTKLPVPYVTLKVGSVHRTRFPVTGRAGNRYYPCHTIAEFNLYTQGSPVTSGGNATGNFFNTAVSDMMDFINFAESEGITDMMAGKGIGIALIPPVRDLTQLQNDSRYRYRAMAETEVTFEFEADGCYGISSMEQVPDSSGGGTEEMAAMEIETIEKVEIMNSEEVKDGIQK